VLGPKIPTANEYHSVLASETQRLLSNQQSADETAQRLKQQLDDMNDV
jgi:multiple sugar transport system substrate-binding protein